MTEELYVETANGLEKLDLNIPSGITLSFKSNLFGDLSKITCSHSYTLTLPMTIRNRRILDFAEDIRHQSTMIRKRLTAHFSQNGVNLFRNANLYIESVNKGYKGILTWGVISGMQELSDGDIPLNELPNDGEECVFGTLDKWESEDTEFDNNASALYPLYNCGIPYYKWEALKPTVLEGHREDTTGSYHYYGYSTYPMPVVPVWRIVDMINRHFNTRFNLGSNLGVGEAKNYSKEKEVVEKGVVPLVGLDLTYDNRQMRRAILSGMKFAYVDKTVKADDGEMYFPDVMTFTQIAVQKSDFLQGSNGRLCMPDKATGDLYQNIGVKPMHDNISIEVDGIVHVGFADITSNTGFPEEEPELSIVQLQLEYSYTVGAPGREQTRSHYKWEELASIKGEYVGLNGTYYVYEFNFAAGEGKQRLAFENAQAGYPIMFKFNKQLKGIFNLRKDIEFFILNNEKVIDKHPIDIIGNLPDIGCLTFMKSLFFMMGAYPYVDNNGDIVARSFDEIRQNLESGNVLNWDSKAYSDSNDGNEEVKFSQSDYAQRNYYLMKSDKLHEEYDPEDIDNDVFADGIGCIEVENTAIDLEKTVIQLPFNAPYILNREWPTFPTGDTMKVWTLKKNENTMSRYKYVREFCKPDPILGIIKDREYGYLTNDGTYVKEGVKMTMETWNGFKDFADNPSFAYLAKIIRQPFVITENLRLNEFDLRDLDYTVPVYLSKYNSYFAVISIQRDSSGKCKCELIKLP